MIETNCHNPLLMSILSIVRRILLMIGIIAPILLIIFATIGFIDLMRNPDDDNKNLKKVINKFIAAAVVFLIPYMVEGVIYLLGENNSIRSCWKNSKEIIDKNTTFNEEDDNRKSITNNPVDYEKGEENSKSNTSFNLEHAISVGDYIHAKENETLQWNGQNLGPIGGSVGAYTEAVNILHEKDYRIYEIYNVVAKLHPEVKTNTKKDIYQLSDVNDYFHLKVSNISRDTTAIKQALLEGKLVQIITDTNLFRNDKNELVNWKGRHWGLLFYYDGKYFHMKNAGSIRQKNAIYTESQLAEWLASKNFSQRPITYEKA